MSGCLPDTPSCPKESADPMVVSTSLSELLTAVFERRPFTRSDLGSGSIQELCHALMSQKTEKSGVRMAESILQRYEALNDEEKLEFFQFLNSDFDLDRDLVADHAQAYAQDPTPENYAALSSGAEAKRLSLFRRLNEPDGATTRLVSMRADLLRFLKNESDLKKVDRDFVHLLSSWFNRGFLVLRQITWESSAAILEKVIAYEAVHEIRTWDDLRRRLQPDDRRCYAFFHPAMPEEPLIFVEIALVSGVPSSVQTLLLEQRDLMPEANTDTAVFYSISNCQKGLAGISFGNSLIKMVANELSRDLPNLKTFVTLSPIPGLSRWLLQNGHVNGELEETKLKQLTAYYLYEEKHKSGLPLDPVARFHLSNGASIHAIHAGADLSDNGKAQSRGFMANYLYDLKKISRNLQHLADSGMISASTNVKSLSRQAEKTLSE